MDTQQQVENICFVKMPESTYYLLLKLIERYEHNKIKTREKYREKTACPIRGPYVNSPKIELHSMYPPGMFNTLQ